MARPVPTRPNSPMRIPRVLPAPTLVPNSSSRATSPSKAVGSIPRAYARTPTVSTLTSKVSGTAPMFLPVSVQVFSSVARSTASPKKKKPPSPSSTRNCSTVFPPKSSSTSLNGRVRGERPLWSLATPVTRRSRSVLTPRSLSAMQSSTFSRKGGIRPHSYFLSQIASLWKFVWKTVKSFVGANAYGIEMGAYSCSRNTTVPSLYPTGLFLWKKSIISAISRYNLFFFFWETKTVPFCRRN